MEGYILYDKEDGLFRQSCTQDNSKTANITYGFTYRRTFMRLLKTIILTCLIGISVAFTLTGCENPQPPEITQAPPLLPTQPPTRLDAIPGDVIKMAPSTDHHPPILYSDEWYPPIPMEGSINTPGAEDSPFISADGNIFTFVFVPDVRVPPEKQLLDGVTGIYMTRKIDEVWTEPERIVLQEPGKVSLDGCQFLQGDEIWFCSAREGNYRGVDIWRAENRGGRWMNWENAGEQFNVEYEMGEFHLTADWKTLYFHSDREGGSGNYDIWVTHLVNGEWAQPENVREVNSNAHDSR
ncbi:MAG: hypothetical protein E3J30_01440, partial [Anaerolineales bacterium]